jgi:protein O-mannosyl-transferase
MVEILNMCSKDAPLQVDWRQRWAADPRRARAWLPVAILVATFLAYADTLDLGFVLDDHVLILTNDSIRSWRYLPSYFASHIWSFHYPHLLANYYRPLFLVWLRLNDALFALRPWGWHLTSALAHVAVTYLVFRLSFKLTRSLGVAAAAGLLFGLHPVHVEAVANVTSVQELLSTFFILAALLTFARSRESISRVGWLAASLALAAAALFSKESGLIAPILISMYAWIRAGGSTARDGETMQAPSRQEGGGDTRSTTRTGVLERLRFALGAGIPYWVVVLAYLPLRIRALKGFAHVITPVALSREIFTIPSVLLFYLRLLIWPAGLSCFYDTPYVSGPTWQGFVLPAALLAVVASAVSAWWWRTRAAAPAEGRVMAFAILWMAVTLLPVLNFSYLPENELAHDRYIYLPSVGFVILFAIALRHAASRAPGFFRSPARTLTLVFLFAAAAGAATARQNLFWSDDLSLNYRAHQIAPHNVSAITSLAAAVTQRGMDRQALTLYQQALAIQPDFWRADVNVAYLYYAHGDFAGAARYFARACAINPTDGDQFLYLGMALLRSGRPSEAETAVRTALLVRPHGKDYRLGLGMVFRQEGKLDDAKREIEAALAEDPQNAQARDLLAEVDRQIQSPGRRPSPGSPSKSHRTDRK